MSIGDTTWTKMVTAQRVLFMGTSRLVYAFVVILLFGPICHAGPVIQTFEFGNNFAITADGTENPVEVPQSFVDAIAGTVDYTLRISLDWVDDVGNPVVGLTGAPETNANSLGADTVAAGLSTDDTGSIQEVTLADGVSTALERLTFEIVDLTSTTGTVVFDGFLNLVMRSGSVTSDGTVIFVATANMGDTTGGRIDSLSASFTTVPEPSPIVGLGLLLVGVGVRSTAKRRRRNARPAP